MNSEVESIEAEIKRYQKCYKDSEHHGLSHTASWYNQARQKLQLELQSSYPDRALDLNKGLIEESVKDRQIECLVHFTLLRNVPSIVQHGLLSRIELWNRNIPFLGTDSERRDGHRNAICISISFPNHKMFRQKRIERREESWSVLLLSTEILWKLDCAFYRTNSASDEMLKQEKEYGQTFDAFNSMFGDSRMGFLKQHRPAGLASAFPTDPQAEVLVFENIKTDYIEGIVVQDHEAVSELEKVINGFRISAKPEYFGQRPYPTTQ